MYDEFGVATNDKVSIAPLACELLHCLGDIRNKSDARYPKKSLHLL
jgi:hypothetical protein